MSRFAHSLTLTHTPTPTPTCACFVLDPFLAAFLAALFVCWQLKVHEVGEPRIYFLKLQEGSCDRRHKVFFGLFSPEEARCVVGLTAHYKEIKAGSRRYPTHRVSNRPRTISQSHTHSRPFTPIHTHSPIHSFTHTHTHILSLDLSRPLSTSLFPTWLTRIAAGIT